MHEMKLLSPCVIISVDPARAELYRNPFQFVIWILIFRRCAKFRLRSICEWRNKNGEGKGMRLYRYKLISVIIVDADIF